MSAKADRIIEQAARKFGIKDVQKLKEVVYEDYDWAQRDLDNVTERDVAAIIDASGLKSKAVRKMVASGAPVALAEAVVKRLAKSTRGKQIKQGLLTAAQGKYTPAQIKEYVNEAEHQDGDGYWDNFSSVGEAMADLKLYFDNYE